MRTLGNKDKRDVMPYRTTDSAVDTYTEDVTGNTVDYGVGDKGTGRQRDEN